MTDSTSTTGLDLREQIIRIDRSIAETEKLQAETRKYVSETRRIDRERWWFPFLQRVTLAVSTAAGGGLVAAIVAHWR
ncbi:MAG: hypothetical protein JO288_19855 [Hyphomicrobiales bacterium]|nr:hypothetical protein [Hyphomicrobiales bacterium]